MEEDDFNEDNLSAFDSIVNFQKNNVFIEGFNKMLNLFR